MPVFFIDFRISTSEKGKPRVTGGHKVTDPVHAGWLGCRRTVASSLVPVFLGAKNHGGKKMSGPRVKAGRVFFTAVLLVVSVVQTVFSAEVIIPARQYVTNTIHIPGGHYTTPYIISTPNTEYILDGDITADGTAIAVRASKVVINLNGKTVTYNQTIPGEGVTVDTYNKSDIAIINGNIFQGAAMSEGDVYGGGNNPVKSIGISGLHIANIHARYGGRDVSGFKIQYVAGSIIEENTLEDVWNVGTFKNRHQGIDAIQASDSYNIVRNNTILNARQRGINIGNYGVVYGNKITLNSLATNSVGISGYARSHIKVYDNSIVARGEHPIGIGFASAGTNDIDIYNNTIDVQTTRIGEEYGGNAACFNIATPCGNYAVGFRTTWGGNNIKFHDNTIIVRTDSRLAGTYSPTGAAVTVNAKGRGLMVAINAGESSAFYNNTITTLDKDGTGKAFGIACTGNNAGNLTFEGNTVTSNILNVALSDEYGFCSGYPLFIKNTFVKADNYPVYKTVAAELGGYYEGTGRFISNTYQQGAAADSLNMNFQNPNKNKSIIFGRLMEGVVRDNSNNALPNVTLKTLNGNNILQTEATTDASGTAKFILYDYELNNDNGFTQSATPITRIFRPHTLEVFDPSNSQTLIRTEADVSATAWDAVNSSGIYTLRDSGGSIQVSTNGAGSSVPSIDVIPPQVTITFPLIASSVNNSVTLSATATDNVGVSKVEFYVNGTLHSTDTTDPYAFTWNTSAIANGTYTLSAKAYDAAGNVGQSAGVTITVNNDKTPPTAAITSPVGGATVLGTTTVNVATSDNVGVSKVELYINGQLAGTKTAAPYSFSWVSGSYPIGSNSLFAYAYDAAGNRAQSAAVQVNVTVQDTVAPVVAVASPLENARIGYSTTIKASATDNTKVVKMTVSVNGVIKASVNSSTLTWTLRKPRSGSHTIVVRAYDAAGNVGSKTVTVYR